MKLHSTNPEMSDDAWLMQNLAYHACLQVVRRRARLEQAWSDERACLNAAAAEISTLIDWKAISKRRPA